MHQWKSIRELQRHSDKLHIGDRGMLQKITADKNYKQIVIPWELHLLVQRTFHVNIGHLVADGITELENDFFWSGMVGFRYFTTKIYPYV